LRGVVLLLAAGEGARLGGGRPKAFFELGGRTLLGRAAEAALAAELVDSIVIAAPAGARSRALDEVARFGQAIVVDGASTRQGSAAAALEVAPDADAYLVHDAARALASPALFDACLVALDECEAVCPVVPVTDTIKERSADGVVRTLDRSSLVAVQTPQAFHADLYRRAHARAEQDGFVGTDDASLVERLGAVVKVIPGDATNMKITTAADVAIAEALLSLGR